MHTFISTQAALKPAMRTAFLYIATLAQVPALAGQNGAALT
jgi:hypothetical protein